ncbi:MAG: vWA domain-containing protein [Candidatus Cyclobacteriaceae bacterium M2_1C_046]
MRVKNLLLLFLFALAAYNLQAQEVQQKLPEKTRILFLLDGSGSMLAKWKDEDRIEAAKRILSDIVDSLRTDQRIELALRVYGHRYFRESQNCQDSKLEVPFAKGNHDRIIDKINSIKPKGTTPIAYSLEQAAEDFPEESGYRNILILITDGIESCGGDPCDVSMALQKKGVFLKPFVVGIGGLSNSYDSQFDCIGKYFNAEDDKAFRQALNKAIKTTLAKTTATVELLDNSGNSRYTNVNVTFQNNFTNTPAFDFIHYLDARGNPDTVTVDPVLDYNLIINTLPPVKANVQVESGKHNTIKVKTPQGKLNVTQNNTRTYPNGIEIIMRDRRGNIFHIQDINTEQNYLEGVYEATVTTLPRKKFNIRIDEGKTDFINLPGPGILNLSNNKHGYGSIYIIEEDKTQEWIGEIKPDLNKSVWVLQPGNYKIVFRSKNAPGSKYTTIKYFTIRSGSSTALQLF